MLKEMDDRKIRESNVLLHRVPESESDSAQERRETDEGTLQYLLDCLQLDLNVAQDVKFVRRRGKPADHAPGTVSEPRPMLVGFRYQQTQVLGS